MADSDEYTFWMFVVLGLKQVKLGIETFVTEQLQQWHNDYMQVLATSLELGTADEVNCSEQTIFPPVIKGNFIPPTQYRCDINNTDDINECVTLCPNVACYKIMKEITQLHRLKRPIWTNTNPNKWTADPSAPWEIAKCFLSSGGFHNTPSYTEIDCAGLLNIIIKMRTITKNLNISDQDIRDSKDVFSKVGFNCLFKRYLDKLERDFQISKHHLISQREN